MMVDEPKFLTTEEAAKLLKVSEASIRRWSNQGKLKCYRIGGRGERRFLLSDLLECIETFKEEESKANHFSLFFRSEKEQLDAVVPFLADYLQRGHRVLYVRDATEEEKLYSLLEERRINVKELTARGSLCIFDSSEVYLKDGYFDMERMFSFWETALEESSKMGYSKVFCSGEMTWYLKGLPGVETMMEYEAKLNRITDNHPEVTILCQYDVNRLSGAVVIDSVISHPMVLLENRCYRGYYNYPT
ncbi:MAG TPA: MEDS domain-containing protein [Thermodesulfobacteriota bacterium]|nr:MEDS domain-containing protein [Thermodesulfobacteriota bacterium]